MLNTSEFEGCGWREVVNKGFDPDDFRYRTLCQGFVDLRNIATEDGDNNKACVFSLLASACSFSMNPSSLNDPFKGDVYFRSVGCKDLRELSGEDVDYLSGVVDVVDDFWLKARIADIVWLRLEPRNERFLFSALDAYIKIPLNKDTWYSGGKDCWGRAIALICWLKDRGKNRSEIVLDVINDVFGNAKICDINFILDLSRILLLNKFGRSRAKYFGDVLRKFSCSSNAQGDGRGSCKCARVAADWYGLAKESGGKSDMLAVCARYYAETARLCESCEDPDYMTASLMYDRSIECFLKISGADKRKEYDVRARVRQIAVDKARVDEWLVTDMADVRVGYCDLSELVGSARGGVAGKSFEEAFLVFCHMIEKPDLKKMKERAGNQLKYPSISMMFDRIIKEGGRTVGKISGASLDGSSCSGPDAIEWISIEEYLRRISVSVLGLLIPALDVLALEHRLLEYDFIRLAEGSPFVPFGRARVFGRALYFGYDRDFVSAVHLLLPQFENMVRWRLKLAGESTINRDSNGVEFEIGLSNLLQHEKARELFDESLLFEFRALFGSPYGVNLRNQVSHGLLNDEDFTSVYAVYVWWLALSLVYNSWWLAEYGNKNQDKKEVDEGAPYSDDNIPSVPVTVTAAPAPTSAPAPSADRH